MKKLSEVVNLSAKSTHETNRQPDSRAMKVWVQLAEMFGKGFYSNHGDEPGHLWQTAIARLTDQQLSRGLANLGNDGLAFPPNLSQFIAACKRIPPHTYLGVKALPNPEQDKRDAEKAWAEMSRLAGRDVRPKSE